MSRARDLASSSVLFASSNPSNPTSGDVYYNTTLNRLLRYDGTSWVFDDTGAIASGGITEEYTKSSVNYRSHTFLANGSFYLSDTKSVDILVVAGGGGGHGSYQSPGGGGGGAGGFQTFTSQSLTSGKYTVVVGRGGLGGRGDGSSINYSPTNGKNSSFGTLTASVGGGQGGGYSSQDAGDGGSGGGEAHGGGSGSGTSGQGNNGGTAPTNDDQNAAGGEVLARLEGMAQTVLTMLVRAERGQPTIIETVLLHTMLAAAVAAVGTAVVTLPMAVVVAVVVVAMVLATTLQLQAQTAFLTPEAAAVAAVALFLASTNSKWLAVMAAPASL